MVANNAPSAQPAIFWNNTTSRREQRHRPRRSLALRSSKPGFYSAQPSRQARLAEGEQPVELADDDTGVRASPPAGMLGTAAFQ